MYKKHLPVGSRVDKKEIEECLFNLDFAYRKILQEVQKKDINLFSLWIYVGDIIDAKNWLEQYLKRKKIDLKTGRRSPTCR